MTMIDLFGGLMITGFVLVGIAAIALAIRGRR